MEHVGDWLSGYFHADVYYDKDNEKHHWWFREINTGNLYPISREKRRHFLSDPWDEIKYYTKDGKIYLDNTIYDFISFTMWADDIKDLLNKISLLMNTDEDEEDYWDEVIELDNQWVKENLPQCEK